MEKIKAICPECKEEIEIDGNAVTVECPKCKKQFKGADGINAYNVSLPKAPEPTPAADFEMDGGTLKKYNGKDSDIVLAGTVTAIGNEAFKSSGIKSIDMSQSKITSIGKGAFKSCKGLTEITLPDELTEIYEDAFFDCTNLSTVKFGNKISIIKSGAFSTCINLQKVDMSKTPVQYLGQKAFYSCMQLSEVILPNSLTLIQPSTFETCTHLSKITLPASLTKIDVNVFKGCRELKEVELPKSAKEIEVSAFEGSGFKYPPDPPKGVDIRCYIATCIYGSYNCPEVVLLRRFRDDSLMPNPFGRFFVRIYYALSPTVVRIFGQNRFFRRFWKSFLDKRVEKLSKKYS